jgi:HD-GYP domain-containing protein (c-di-GMP phosphodiesterase class II)
MTTNRPYQSAMEIDYALGKIRALVGTKFDPDVVDALELIVKAGRLRLAAVEVPV